MWEQDLATYVQNRGNVQNYQKLCLTFFIFSPFIMLLPIVIMLLSLPVVMEIPTPYIDVFQVTQKQLCN